MDEKIRKRAKEKVNKQATDFYNQMGVVYISQALNEEELERLTLGIEMNLKNLSNRAKIASPEADTGRFVEDFCNWQKNPFYKKIIFESPLATIAALLMGAKKVRLYHDHLLVKEPYTQTITPWHQDLPYYNIQGMQNCSIWVPVDPVERESTLEFVARSHLGPCYTPRTFKDNKAKWFPKGILSELPSDTQIRNNNQILGWPLMPGDIVVFNMLTLHSSQGVLKNQRRRAFSIRFIGDDVTFAPRPWPTSPDFPGLNEEIKAGSPMQYPLFPIVYEQNNEEI